MKRRKWLLWAGSAGSAASLVHLPSWAQGVTAPAAIPETPEMAEMASVLATRLKHEGVGFVSLQVDGSGAPRFAAAGRVAAEREEAPDEHMRFEYGSITKTFTALLLAELVVRGELKLDERVDALLPDGQRLLDSAGEPLRLVDLATHRSGLPRLPPNLAPRAPTDPYADYDAAALWAGLAAWKPTRQRNAEFEYSNLGFGLLGQVLARRLKTDYAAALRQRVLLPLGLGGVIVRTLDAVVANAAQGHDAQRRPVPPWRFDALAGAGALVGSAVQLARYAQCAIGLVEHPLADAFGLALQRRAAGPNAATGIGLAWLLVTIDGRDIAGHDGATSGFSTSLFLARQERRAAGVLANAPVGVADLALHALDARSRLRDVVAEAAHAAQLGAAASQPAMAVSAEALAALGGSYALNPQFKVVIRPREGRLFAQATGQGEFELFAVTARRFVARVAPIEIDFEGVQGIPVAFELRQSGVRLRFVRE